MAESVFKVRDTKTGLFSSGGYDISWSETGKSWDTFAAVIQHLKLYKRGRWDAKNNTVPSTWEIVEFKLEPCSRGPWPARLILNAKPAKK